MRRVEKTCQLKGHFTLRGAFWKRDAEMRMANVPLWQLGCVRKVWHRWRQSHDTPLFCDGTGSFSSVYSLLLCQATGVHVKMQTSTDKPSIFEVTALVNVYILAAILTTFLLYISRVNKHRLNSNLFCGCIGILKVCMIWSEVGCPDFFCFFPLLWLLMKQSHTIKRGLDLSKLQSIFF